MENNRDHSNLEDLDERYVTRKEFDMFTNTTDKNMAKLESRMDTLFNNSEETKMKVNEVSMSVNEMNRNITKFTEQMNDKMNDFNDNVNLRVDSKIDGINKRVDDSNSKVNDVQEQLNVTKTDVAIHSAKLENNANRLKLWGIILSSTIAGAWGIFEIIIKFFLH